MIPPHLSGVPKLVLGWALGRNAVEDGEAPKFLVSRGMLARRGPRRACAMGWRQQGKKLRGSRCGLGHEAQPPAANQSH